MNKENNIIFYKTTADFDNTGEVLIYKSLLELLRRQGKVIIDDSAKIQPLFLNRIQIKKEEKLSNNTSLSFTVAMIIFALKALFSSNKINFVTGVGDHVVSGNKDILKNIYSFIFCLLLRVLNVRIIRIGMSIRFAGKFEALSEQLLALAFNYYYVRDSLSLQNCKKAGISKCRLAPDLSWAYVVNNAPSTNKKYIIFSLRDFGENHSPYVVRLTEVVVALIASILDKNPKQQILFTYQVDKDLPFMQQIYDACKNYHTNITLIPDLITLENAHKYYGNSSLVFSNRLHILLLAYKYNALTIGLTDLQKYIKITGIFKDAKLSDQLIEINQPFNKIEANYKKLTESLQDRIGAIKNIETNYRLELQSVMREIF
jgi:polysaccharide pyruvyl transferase WcaK-like protein